MSAFPEIKKIQYEGPESKNPLAFRWYNEEEVIEGEALEAEYNGQLVSYIPHRKGRCSGAYCVSG